MTVYPVILAGGSGTRLWPLSREYYPKQFLPLIRAGSSMLQDTLARLEMIEDAAPPIVVCSELHRFILADQLREAGVEPTSVIVEPAGRNTAPALTLGALRAQDAADDDDPILLVTHSDHLITEPERFLDAFRVGLELASDGNLVAFGVPPTGPETGYGYVERGDPLASAGGRAYAIQSFVEKPDRRTATEFCESGRYLWNSGLFMMRASVWLARLERHRPDIAGAVREAYSNGNDFFDYFRPDADAFLKCPSDSIDYAVMEGAGADGEDESKAATGYAVVPIDVGWSDIGSWSTLWERRDQDDAGNVLQGDVYADSTRNSLIFAQHRLVAAVGLDDVVVIETSDAVLVAHKDRVQDVKGIVELLRARGRPEADLHRRVHRPWGTYDILDAGEGFQVKRLTISPGASVSLQYHHHRAEHWIVVRGTAKVTRGDEVFLLRKSESISIPKRARHRLENPGTTPLEVIEAQLGESLDEDDIVRLQDNYNRVTEPEDQSP